VSRDDGLFVCLDSDPPEYAERFTAACRDIGISVGALSRVEALEREPTLGPSVSGAFVTPDGIIDPFILVEAHLEDLIRLGVEVWLYHTLIGATLQPNGWRLQVEDCKWGTRRTVAVNAVVNAAGPWAADVAAVFGIQLPLVYVHGSMAVLERSLVRSVVTRCAPPSMGDVVIPSGNACLVGSTWHQLPHNDPIEMDAVDWNTMMRTASTMVPEVTRVRVVRSFTGIRTHLTPPASAPSSNFETSRDYAVINHSERDRMYGLVTALGGKLVLYRYVAELVGDLVMHQLGLERPCQTRGAPLPYPEHPSGRMLSDPR